MDIDLLFTNSGEAGLIANGNFIKKAIGVVLDTRSGILTMEYADSDYLEFNIPVESEFFPVLDATAKIHIGAIKNGNIAQAYQVPLMFLDDPYRGEMLRGAREAASPLQAFNAFVRRCANGQPVHRDDLGDEKSMGCVLGDAVPASLQFAPHLARRHALEAGHKIAAPNMAPRMAGPGLGSMGGGVYQPPPKKTGEDD